MTLDPQARAYLEQTADAPPIGEIPVAEARDFYVAQARAPAEDGPLIEAVADRLLPAGDHELRARLYAPTGGGPLPLVVFLHGGGWVLGGVETHDGLCRALAHAAGAAVLSVGYRLAPEHPFPAACDDALAAVRWAAEHAGELGVDRRRMAVAGDSAGGNLAAVAALRVRDEGGPPLRLQLLAYPIVDCAMDTASYAQHATGYGLTLGAMRWYWDQYAPDRGRRAHPHVAPLRADTLAGLPPALVITAEHDPLRDEGEAYAARLRAAGVSVTHTRYPGMIHGFLRIAELDACGQAVRQSAAALREALV